MSTNFQDVFQGPANSQSDIKKKTDLMGRGSEIAGGLVERKTSSVRLSSFE
jgi:hypothetical protein